MRWTVAIDGLVTSRSTCDRKLSVTPARSDDVAQRQASRLADGADAAPELRARVAMSGRLRCELQCAEV